MNEVDQLGEIFIKKTTINSPFKEATVNRAQIQFPVQEIKSIDNIQFQLRKTVNVEKKNTSMWLTGCTMLSNGNVLIADYVGKNFIMEYSEDGEHIRDIPCSNEPFDFTVMGSEHIAVSYGDSKYIEILDMKNAPVGSNYVQCNGECYGISYQDNKLFINMNGIVITNITGKVLKTLNINWQYQRLYLKTTKDKIYFTSNSTVTCISMSGEKIWEHTMKSSVSLRGITVDDHENVYVADEQSNTVISIQHDGQSSRHVLTKSSGLCKTKRVTLQHRRKRFTCL
ncbi:unnamed protein product [Mytilus edulis]|uniref:TRIM2_3 n=1 Tax=Mytilus edulis TaxID=6550 RepID=A0A8S3TXN0_MYTED|nr:unnamed protein product [Mytilus edulis]